MEGQKKQYEETWAFRQGFISDSKPELSLGGEEGQSTRGYSWKENLIELFRRFITVRNATYSNLFGV